MAVINIGTIVVDMEIPVYYPFPLVPVEAGNGYVFDVAASPLDATLDFSYLIITPLVRVAGRDLLIGEGMKWFPRAIAQSFVVPVYAGLPGDLFATILLYPVQIYPRRASPPSFSVTAEYENTLVQPLGFGV